MHQVFPKHAGRPLVKARALSRFDPIADGDDGVEVVVLEDTLNLAFALSLNYREILGSCRFL